MWYGGGSAFKFVYLAMLYKRLLEFVVPSLQFVALLCRMCQDLFNYSNKIKFLTRVQRWPRFRLKASRVFSSFWDHAELSVLLLLFAFLPFFIDWLDVGRNQPWDEEQRHQPFVVMSHRSGVRQHKFRKVVCDLERAHWWWVCAVPSRRHGGEGGHPSSVLSSC